MSSMSSMLALLSLGAHPSPAYFPPFADTVEGAIGTPATVPVPPSTVEGGFSQAAASGTAEADVVVTARPRRSPGDPLARINARSFAAAQAVDGALVGPLTHGYEHVLPSPVRLGVHNFLENLHEPNVFVNYMLQMKPGKAAETLGRFAVNSTVGLAGLVDVARRRPFGLPRRRNGFADTFGYYGVKPGPFVFLPVVGATTPRDLVGLVLDRLLLPVAVGSPFGRPAYSIPTGVLHTLDRRSGFEAELAAVRATDDPYAARRDLYLSTRQAEIDHLRGRATVTDAGCLRTAPPSDNAADAGLSCAPR